MKAFLHLVVALFLVLCLSNNTFAQGSYSLDDINPTGFGAEDPFGIFGPPGFAPSPTLGGLGAHDGMILDSTGGVPAVQHPGPNGPSMASLSSNYAGSTLDRLRFSVDRLATGAPGTAVASEAALFEAATDIYDATGTVPDPSILVGTLAPGFNGLLPTAGFGAGNSLLIDGSPGFGLIEPGLPPSIGTQDNIDAYDSASFDGPILDGLLNRDTYFTIYPDEAITVGTSSADIFAAAAGDLGAIPTPYASAPMLGLDAFGFNTDNIDALLLFDRGTLPLSGGPPPGIDPGLDYALFSLSPGSTSLPGFGFSPGDILFTDFSGGFGIYATTADLGLSPFDNVDAISTRSLIVVPEPGAFASLLVIGLAGLVPARRRRRR